MRARRGTMTTVAVAALAAAAGAQAFFTVDFTGHVSRQPDSFVGFNVEKLETGGKAVTAFTVERIAYTCDDGSVGTSTPMQFKKAFRIRNREFDGTARTLSDNLDPT